MTFDANGLIENVMPLINKGRTYLNSATNIISSIDIPDDFPSASTLRSTIYNNINNIDNTLSIVKNWLNKKVDDMNEAERKNKEIFAARQAIIYERYQNNINQTGTVVSKVKETSSNDLNSTGAETASNVESIFTKLGKGFLKFVDGIKNVGATIFKHTKSVIASIANVIVGLVKGIAQFIESLLDLIVMLGTGVASIFTGIYDGIQAINGAITGEEWSSATKKMWSGVMGYVAEDHVGNVVASFYKDTAVGQWLDTNAYTPFKSDGVACQIASGLGYVIGLIALTIATAGIGSAAVSGAGAAVGVTVSTTVSSAISSGIIIGSVTFSSTTAQTWASQRDKSWEGIERLFKNGEIDSETYENFKQINNMSDEEWLEIEKAYKDGYITEEDYNSIKSIKEIPTEWKTTENLFTGFKTGAKEGGKAAVITVATMGIGSKIAGFVNSKIPSLFSKLPKDGKGILTKFISNFVEESSESAIEFGSELVATKTVKGAYENTGGAFGIAMSMMFGMLLDFDLLKGKKAIADLNIPNKNINVDVKPDPIIIDDVPRKNINTDSIDVRSSKMKNTYAYGSYYKEKGSKKFLKTKEVKNLIVDKLDVSPNSTSQFYVLSDVKTNKDIWLDIPKDLKPWLQSITPERLINVLDDIPQEYRKYVKNIHILDTYNPADSYWKKVYKGFNKSFATGGKGEISFYRNSESIFSQSYLKDTVMHEIGHNLDLVKGKGKSWSKLQDGPWINAVEADYKFKGKKSPTKYGLNSMAEDFAESLVYYNTNPKKFNNDFPNRYKALNELLEVQSKSLDISSKAVTKSSEYPIGFFKNKDINVKPNLTSNQLNVINQINDNIKKGKKVKITYKNTTDISSTMLSKIDDLSKVEFVVVDGLGDADGNIKKKYSTDPRYSNRITYNGNELEEIIKGIENIQAKVDMSLPEIDRAKQLYNILAKDIPVFWDFDDFGDVGSNIAQSLRGISSNNAIGKSGLICAGYSSLYKELCDRVGIRADYIRGRAIIDPLTGKGGKHAWNVVITDEGIIPVDVTWKASSGKEWFGPSEEFASSHISDLQEEMYNQFNIPLKPNLNIDMSIAKNTTEYINSVLKIHEQTYPGQGIIALRKIIAEGNYNSITRTGDARNYMKNVPVSEIEQYIKKYDSIRNAITNHDAKYGSGVGMKALQALIDEKGNYNRITSANGARDGLKQYTASELKQFLESSTMFEY